MSYEDLLATGKESVPDALRQAVFDEVTRVNIDCELIIFTLPDVTLYTIHKNGTVLEHNNFCAIGSGSPNAESWLHFREQSQNFSLERTLIHLYEAKRFSETAPGVGKRTRMIAITNDEENAIILDQTPFDSFTNSSALDAFARMWKKYGPHSTDTKEVAIFVIPEGARYRWDSRGLKRSSVAG